MPLIGDFWKTDLAFPFADGSVQTKKGEFG